MDEKRSNNLCSTYMLPLVGLNRLSFGETNFISSFVADDNTHLVIELRLITAAVNVHPCFRFDFQRESKSYAVYEVPIQLRDTLKKFREGKYSEFSNEAKSLIRKKSGLKYKVPLTGGKYESARELLVLDKDKELRKVMEQDLSVKIHQDAELASIPGEDNFFKLNLSTSIPSEVVVTN
jgi:hypothetical protein